MKSVCLFILLISAIFSEAQSNGDYAAYPTQFDKFIENPSIQYAIYANDTLRFNKFNLSDYLKKEMHQNKIITAHPMGAGTEQANKIQYNKTGNFDYKLYPGCTLAIYPPSEYDPPTPPKPSNENDSLIYNLVNIIQILYIEKDKLQSYIPWVSPQICITTSHGYVLGLSDYFNTCINFRYNFKSNDKDKYVQLETTKRRIKLDSIPRCDKLKQLYGRSLAETIWCSLIANKNEAFDIKTNKKLSIDSLQNFSIALPDTYAQYDGNGNVIGYKTDYEPVQLKAFNEVEITQNWQYNITKNILTSTIPEIILYAKREGDNEASPIIKVVFK